MHAQCKDCRYKKTKWCSSARFMEIQMSGIVQCHYGYATTLAHDIIRVFPNIPEEIIHDLSHNLIESELHPSLSSDKVHMKRLMDCWDEVPDEFEDEE